MLATEPTYCKILLATTEPKSETEPIQSNSLPATKLMQDAIAQDTGRESILRTRMSKSTSSDSTRHYLIQKTSGFILLFFQNILSIILAEKTIRAFTFIFSISNKPRIIGRLVAIDLVFSHIQAVT